jgi:hypothetical protein
VGNPAYNVQIYSNIFIDPKIVSIANRSYSMGCISVNNASIIPSQIYNNTIVNTFGSCKNLISIVSSKGAVIKNNIVFQNKGEGDLYPLFVSKFGRDPLMSNNCWYHSKSDVRVSYRGKLYKNKDHSQWRNKHPGAIFEDPLLIDLNNDVLGLQGESPCINTGKKLGLEFATALDPDEFEFPFSPANQGEHGEGWEMGAFIFRDLHSSPSKNLAYPSSRP